MATISRRHADAASEQPPVKVELAELIVEQSRMLGTPVPARVAEYLKNYRNNGHHTS